MFVQHNFSAAHIQLDYFRFAAFRMSLLGECVRKSMQ